MNLKKLLLATVFITSVVGMEVEDNMGSSLMIMSNQSLRNISSQRTKQHYLDDFELMYQVKLTEMKKIKGRQEAMDHIGTAIGLSIVAGVGVIYGMGHYFHGFFEAQNSYIRRRPSMFVEMFPDSNEQRDDALRIITEGTNQYIKDKKDYPFFGSHTVLSMFR